MTYDKLPGVYFSETVNAEPVYSQEYNPLFIVQTSTEITSLDNQIVEFSSFDSFKNIVANKGLTKTVKHMENILVEAEVSKFYVYSIKVDTAVGFTDAVKSTAHLDEVTNVIYIEETKSSDSNSITSKVTAIKTGLVDNAENGVFRVGYIIPDGTVSDAVENMTTGTIEEVVVNTMVEITAGEGHGRICMVLPDSLAGSIVGKCINTVYNVDAGQTAISNLDLSGVYNFNSLQMKSLQNNGIMFVRPEKVQGVRQYRINFALTTSFKESKADGQLICRFIVDEMLRQIGFRCQAFVKARESESALVEMEASIGAVIDEFSTSEDINREGTILTVSEKDNMTFEVNGTIQPIGSTFAVEVNTTLM